MLPPSPAPHCHPLPSAPCLGGEGACSHPPSSKAFLPLHLHPSVGWGCSEHCRGLRLLAPCSLHAEASGCASSSLACGAGVCVLTPDGYSCSCHLGYMLHPSRLHCVGMLAPPLLPGVRRASRARAALRLGPVSPFLMLRDPCKVLVHSVVLLEEGYLEFLLLSTCPPIAQWGWLGTAGAARGDNLSSSLA